MIAAVLSVNANSAVESVRSCSVVAIKNAPSATGNTYTLLLYCADAVIGAACTDPNFSF